MELEEIKKDAEYIDTTVVPTVDGDIEVEILSAPSRPNGEWGDPFAKLSINSLPTKIKRNLKRQAKAKSLNIENTIGYDVLQIVSPPYNLEQLAKLYELDSIHNACVTAKAVCIAGLGHKLVYSAATQLKIEEGQSGSEESIARLMRRIKIEQMAVEEKLNSLNEEQTFDEILTEVWTDVESLGVGYIEVGRNRDGSIGYIGRAPAKITRIRSERDGFVQVNTTFAKDKYVRFFRNFGDTTTPDPFGQDANPNELIYFYKYTPNSSYYGIPDIVPAMSAVAGNSSAKEYNLDYFENKAVPRYAFIVKGAKLGKEAQQQLVNFFRNEVKGKHHGTLYIPLPASIGHEVSAEFKALEVGVQDSSFINYIKLNNQEIMSAHRTPPTKIGITDNSNLAVSRDMDKTFKEQVCAPEQRRIEKKLNRLISEFTDTFKLQLLSSDIIDADIKSRIHDRYARIQVMSPNEIREDIGKTARPEGNEVLPFQKGPNENGPGQKTSEGARPRTVSPADDTGQRQPKGTGQDAGESPL